MSLQRDRAGERRRAVFQLELYQGYTLFMKQKRTLRRVGGSIMVPIPPPQLQASGLHEGDVVLIEAEPGQLTIKPAAPELDPQFVVSVERALLRYQRAWEELAQR